VSFAAITHCVAFERVFILLFISLSTQSGNFWIHARITIWNVMAVVYLRILSLKSFEDWVNVDKT
jgi:hypothetical protein